MLKYSFIAKLKTSYPANLNYTKLYKIWSTCEFLWKSFFVNMPNEDFRKICKHNYTENLHQKSEKYLMLSPEM